jgi:RimJ/RimL family protein N-acetyltransferase
MPLHPAYPIRTERLALRPFTPDDLDAVLDLESREDVVRYLNWGPMDRDAAAALLQRRLALTTIEGDGTAILLAATVPPEDRLIGEFMLRLTSEANRQGEIGWTLHPDAQGRGYGIEGAREMLRLGFDELGLHRIVAEADPRNDASIRLMQRLGMRFEAEHRDAELLKGEWVGSTVYAMLEDEWRALQEAGATARPAALASRPS